jgi:hypothetical protein
MAGAVTSSERFTPGARVGDYHIERELGDDATGIIYLATHVVLPRQTHLKVTRSGARTAAVQLLREACILEALARPGHPGIPHVYECGVLGDRRPWAAIERMTGVSFETFASDGPVGLSELVVAIRDLADMLRHAHERGVVHGALTQTAVIRTQRRRSIYAIPDWSTARTLDSEDEVAVDPREDIRALGAIAFGALTGVASAEGISAGALCPEAPGELIAVIDQMIGEPADRPGATEVFDRAAWLCETLEVAPVIERPRWTPPQGYVPEGVSARRADGEVAGFAVRIGRPRSS